TMFNSSSVYEPLSLSGVSLGSRCEGLVVEVYENKLVVRGRDFLASTWLDNAQYSYSLNRDFR
ncbi:MAG TPA: metallophosphoesterase, partial [Verrucomicrobiae bacterium]|nr:metallophosphoesterase [Verrucomicrobiae bacterium]